MNELTLQGLNHAYSKFDADEFDDALEEIRRVAAAVTDPWEKAELLYYESMFLLESNRIVDARQTVTHLAEALETLVPSPSDGYEYDVSITLPVMACHANLRVTVKEGKTLEALRLIEDLMARYPKQLSLPQFQMMFDEVETLRGQLLGDAGRWAEAKPYLEAATPPERWRGFHLYYLGLCYYKLGDNLNAKKKFSEALDVGLKGAWEVRAHLNLGFAEYKLSNMEAAKRQFEICAKSPDRQAVDLQIVWEALEATARALGLATEAENYKRLRIVGPSAPRID
jgi:tetratricopeptide (TPR) repeat protein